MKRNTPEYWAEWDPLIEAVSWFTGEKVIAYDPDIAIEGITIPRWLAERMLMHYRAARALLDQPYRSL